MDDDGWVGRSECGEDEAGSWLEGILRKRYEYDYGGALATGLVGWLGHGCHSGHLRPLVATAAIPRHMRPFKEPS